MAELLTIEMLKSSEDTLWLAQMYPEGLEIPDGDLQITCDCRIRADVGLFIERWPNDLLKNRTIRLDWVNPGPDVVYGRWSGFESDGTCIYKHDHNGNPASATDPNEGTTTSYTYDENGKLMRVKDQDGDTITYTYDSNGRRTSVRYPSGLVIYLTYDTNGNLLRVEDDERIITSFTYDENNNRTTELDGYGNTTRYEYDENNRVCRAIYPDDSVEEYTRDENDICLSTTVYYTRLTPYHHHLDENGTRVYETRLTMTRTYDKYGNVTTIAYPDGRFEDLRELYKDTWVTIQSLNPA